MKHEGEAHGHVSRETQPTEETWSALERWLGLLLSGDQRDLLVRYHEWLADEAAEAGGIGPAELNRLYDRHIFDSLGYLSGFPDPGTPTGSPPISSLVDVGSGVGLPGIPLAIACPEGMITLVDRAERRTLLARRAIRVLGLTNVEVVTADARSMRDRFDVVAFRASLPIEEAVSVYTSLANPGGTGLLGVSRRLEQPSLPEPPTGVAYELTSELPEVLDSPFWLLRMQRT